MEESTAVKPEGKNSLCSQLKQLFLSRIHPTGSSWKQEAAPELPQPGPPTLDERRRWRTEGSRTSIRAQPQPPGLHLTSSSHSWVRGFSERK